MGTDAREKKIIAVLFAAGMLIRIFFMCTTYFGDIYYIYMPPMLWTEHGHFNIYDYIKQHGQMLNGWIYYPPALFFVVSGTIKSITAVLPGFPQWIELLNRGDIANAMADPSRFQYLFAMKLPFLLCDAAATAILLRIGRPNIRKFIVAFWILNPQVIHTTYIVGQFDVLIALCMAAAILLFYRDKQIASSLVLGAATALKVFPGIVLFLQSFTGGKKPGRMILLFMLGILISVALTVPFLLHRGTGVLESYFTYPGIGSAEGGGVAKFFIRLTPVILLSFYMLAKQRSHPDFLTDATVVLLSTFLLTVRFEDRYLLWIYPAVIIYASQDKKTALLPILILIFVNLSTLTFYSDVITNVFSPLAGKPLHINWIPEYCAAHGLIAPHKIFKISTKLFMAILVFRILIQKKKSSIDSDDGGNRSEPALKTV